jgi:hypothetical protein
MKRFLLFFIIFFANFSHLISKIDIVKDSRGTDFWLTFLPNYHNNYYERDPKLKYGDSLYIFIASQEPTRGKIEYKDQEGIPFVYEFEITDPSKMHIFSVPSYYFELKGFNLSIVIVEQNNKDCQTEKISPNSFHITTEKEVSVYALNQAVTTSDAFMVLPTDVLGKRYFILSYNSDGSFGSPTTIEGSSTPSQFAIVATEDSTYVSIYPACETFGKGFQYQQVFMNRGDVYLVQASITYAYQNNDLTGTEIVASKPIAVFSGHQRATVPISTKKQTNNPSRDILIEQLPPVSTWGKNSIVIPLAKSSNESSLGNNLFRVLAAEDNTDIYIDGVRVGTLKQGGFYEGNLNRPYYISSNKPILVGVFKKTCGSGGTGTLGDPFFAIMPPVEQYMDEYRVINSQAYEYDSFFGNYGKVYQEQYISIIIPKVSWQSLRIDNSSLALADIKDVPNSEYVYATIRVSDGVHYIKADTGFGVLIYGYGGANSYGYIGGSNYLILNYLEPQITTLKVDTCFVSKGIAYKNRPRDAALRDFVVVDSLLFNAELYQMENRSDTIKFAFRLLDKFKDGRYGVYVVDTMNLVSQLLVEWIRGFTLGVEGKQPGEVISISGETATGKDFCFDLPIFNFGRFPQNLNALYLKNTKIFPKNFSPQSVEPSQKVNFQFCFTFPSDTIIVDTLVIENECAQIPVAAVNVTFATDKFPPKVLFSSDSCMQTIEIVVADSLSFDKGLKSVEITEKLNCETDIINEFPRKAKINIRIIDFRKDAYIKIVSEDLAGNKIEYEKEIPGFTLSFAQDFESPVQIGSYFLGDIVCAELPLFNNGRNHLIIDRAYFLRNLEFSVAPSSLPIVIPPQGKIDFRYCFNPLTSGNIVDTLVIEYTPFCISMKIPFVGAGKTIDLTTNSNCNVPLSSKITSRTNQSGSVQVYPIPVGDILYVDTSPLSDLACQIQIFDILGSLLFEKVFEKGMGLLELDLRNLSPGMYSLIMKFEGGLIKRTNFEKF